MKSRKYPTLESAITELEKIGKLQYWGRIDADTNLYTYIIGGVKYTLYIYLDGKVEIRE